jgi:pimeloyl-ACP methyl ester carboxylesterase
LPRPIERAIVAAIALSACASPTPKPSPPSPQEPRAATGTVDVGGYDLFYTCRGEGTPTVVLEAGLDTAGSSAFAEFIPQLDELNTRACTYDRAGTGSSDPRPASVGKPNAGVEADELHRLLEGAKLEPPFVLVTHSYGGLITRVFADRYPDAVAGFVFEDVSTAWEIDLWPKWDDSPWIDGGQVTDIDATEREVLHAAPLGNIPTVVASQDTYDEEGIPDWAGPIFARQQGKLAALGDNVIHVRATGSGHWIHEDSPEVMTTAISVVVEAVRGDGTLPACEEAFDGLDVTCLS